MYTSSRTWPNAKTLTALTHFDNARPGTVCRLVQQEIRIDGDLGAFEIFMQFCQTFLHKVARSCTFGLEGGSLALWY